MKVQLVRQCCQRNILKPKLIFFNEAQNKNLKFYFSNGLSVLFESFKSVWEYVEQFVRGNFMSIPHQKYLLKKFTELSYAARSFPCGRFLWFPKYFIRVKSCEEFYYISIPRKLLPALHLFNNLSPYILAVGKRDSYVLESGNVFTIEDIWSCHQMSVVISGGIKTSYILAVC